MADMWARTARTSLDMRMESFFAQMPDDLASAQWYRSSSGRQVHTMTWSDGSEVVVLEGRPPRRRAPAGLRREDRQMTVC